MALLSASPPPLVPAPGRSRPHRCSAARRRNDPRAVGEPPPAHLRLRARGEELSPRPGRCCQRPGRLDPLALRPAPLAPPGLAEPWPRPDADTHTMWRMIPVFQKVYQDFQLVSLRSQQQEAGSGTESSHIASTAQQRSRTVRTT